MYVALETRRDDIGGFAEGVMRCEIDVPEQTLIGLGEACNCDFVAEVSAFREMLRSSDAALPCRLTPLPDYRTNGDKEQRN
jgi:hypothetical protein